MKTNKFENKFIYSIMAAVMLITGCSSDANVPVNETSNSTSFSSQETQNTTETTLPPTPTPVVYDFEWSDLDTDEFNGYFQTLTGGRNIRGYIWTYGFDAEINKAFTDFVNQKYGREYDYIPFSKVNYFRSFVSIGSRAHSFDDYDMFCKCFFNRDLCAKGTFNNMLITSYLIQNNIIFGERVPVENMKCIMGKETFTFDTSHYDDYHRNVGNYELPYDYTDEDLFTALIRYNLSLTTLCEDIRNPDMDLFTTDPEHSQDCEELRQRVNDYLLEYYGDGAPQLGEIPTIENYNVMFPGEELVDVTHIPGGIFDPNDPRIDEAIPDISEIELNETTIDENLLGEWTGYLEAAGFTYIYTFNDDNTGTFTTIHSVTDSQSGSETQQTSTLDFTYSIQYGMLTIEFSNGNSIKSAYDITDDTLSFNKLDYERS